MSKMRNESKVKCVLDSSWKEMQFIHSSNHLLILIITFYLVNVVIVRLEYVVTGLSCFFFQIQVQACDQREPQRCVQTTASITIDRNERSPVFLNTPYSRSLGQGTQASDNIIFTVTATDPDLNPNTVCLSFIEITWQLVTFTGARKQLQYSYDLLLFCFREALCTIQ
jgi:hypothetical protein